MLGPYGKGLDKEKPRKGADSNPLARSLASDCDWLKASELVDVELNWRRVVAEHTIVRIVGNIDRKFAAGLSQLFGYRDVFNATERCRVRRGQ